MQILPSWKDIQLALFLKIKNLKNLKKLFASISHSSRGWSSPVYLISGFSCKSVITCLSSLID